MIAPTPRAIFAAAVLEWWWDDPKTPSIQAVVASLRQEESPDGTRPALILLPEELEMMENERRHMVAEVKSGAVHDGREVTTIGDRLRVGHMPPWFELDAARGGKDKPSKIGIESLGSKFILLSVPSLDTPVCDEEVKRFADLKREVPDYKILVASMDLPFAQHRWITEELSTTDDILAGSDHRTGAFGQAYGVLMKEPRQLMRAVFVARDGYVKWCEYVHDSDKQVDFDAAIAAAKK